MSVSIDFCVMLQHIRDSVSAPARCEVERQIVDSSLKTLFILIVRVNKPNE
jgi:hypothetical protein